MKTINVKSVECRVSSDKVEAAPRRLQGGGDALVAVSHVGEGAVLPDYCEEMSPPRDCGAGAAATLLRRGAAATRAFTIVELLVVIAIIGILAALLLPVLSQAKIKAQKTQAKKEMSDIVVAVQQYDSVYGRFPVSAAAQSQAAANAQAGGNPDFTYGGMFLYPGSALPVAIGTPVNSVIRTNSELIGILMNLTNFPNGVMTENTNYQKNPQQTIFLSAKMSGYDPTIPDPHPPGGVDVTGVYRDPWGNPYVITMDLNYDEQCRDAFYCSNTVSGPVNPGYNGLVSPEVAPATGKDDFQYHGKVMVWSAGPDGKIDTIPANQGANKDNVISWQ